MNASELLARECAAKNLWREAARALALRCEGGVVVASDPECGEARASLVMRQRSDQMQHNHLRGDAATARRCAMSVGADQTRDVQWWPTDRPLPYPSKPRIHRRRG